MAAFWGDGRLIVRDLALTRGTAELRLQGSMVWRDPLSINGRGTLGKPIVTAEMAVQQPRLNHQPRDAFHLNAKLKNRQLVLDAGLNFKFHASCRIYSGDFELTARLTDADLCPCLAMGGAAQWGGQAVGPVASRRQLATSQLSFITFQSGSG